MEEIFPRQILGISEKADPKEIRRAYRRLVSILFPDINPVLISFDPLQTRWYGLLLMIYQNHRLSPGG